MNTAEFVKKWAYQARTKYPTLASEMSSDLAAVRRAIIEETEWWKPVVGWEGLYEVSSLGRVRSLRQPNGRGSKERETPFILMQHPNVMGYNRVQLCRNGLTPEKTVHSLVLEAFIGPRPQGLVADHIDGNVLNNAVQNLRWITTKQNLSTRKLVHGENHHNAVLSEDDIRNIRLLSKEGKSSTIIGEKFGVDPSTIRLIVARKTWKHVV